MGDTLGEGIENETPVHEVSLDEFYMARFPVTQTQWMTCMKENPSSIDAPENPVEQVTWQMACEFAERLTAAVGGGVRFDLPTESQWEYAARSGGRDDLYAGGSDIDAVAWFDENSGGGHRPVGQKIPNALGLYDMSGNVWEWCRDGFREDAYGRHARRNPVVDAGGLERVIRGGGWNLDAWSARCARRSSLRADFFGPALGFRMVMSLNL
jgi:formylglycine-generating enzyme required for sulfatase activity